MKLRPNESGFNSLEYVFSLLDTGRESLHCVKYAMSRSLIQLYRFLRSVSEASVLHFCFFCFGKLCQIPNKHSAVWNITKTCVFGYLRLKEATERYYRVSYFATRNSL